MNRRRWLLLVLLLLIALLAGVWVMASRMGVNPPLPQLVTQKVDAEVAYLQTPEGFQLSVFASGLDAPRMLKVTPAGVLVSLPGDGSIVLLRDENKDGRADKRDVIVSELNRPHGIEVAGGWLYVAETDAVGRVAFNVTTGKVTGSYQHIFEGLPSSKGHWTRTVKMGPQGWLYVTVGSSCNVCIEADAKRAAMLRMRADGSAMQLYASGLRNSVDFDWSPIDDGLYATDNGRDWLGDDFPPDELNRIVEGGFYGWPYANGNRVPDPDFGDDQRALIAKSIAPVFEFRAHNAPLGMTFLTAQAGEYQHAALVALHGSWNRTSKDGYKVVSLHWTKTGAIEARDFVTGFLAGESVLGRPVSVVEDEAGVIFISDDYAGVIYRLMKDL